MACLSVFFDCMGPAFRERRWLVVWLGIVALAIEVELCVLMLSFGTVQPQPRHRQPRLASLFGDCVCPADAPSLFILHLRFWGGLRKGLPKRVQAPTLYLIEKFQTKIGGRPCRPFCQL